MTTTLFLYLLPSLDACSLGSVPDGVVRRCLVVATAPRRRTSSYLPKYIPNEETEHVVRHALWP